MRFTIFLLLVACEKPATTKPAENQPVKGSAARVVPKVAKACQTTADCIVTSMTLEDAAPETYACCSGCSETAVSMTSFSALQAWCEVNPSPRCPALDCKMIPKRAECEAGQCVAKDASVVRPSPPARVVPTIDTACQTTADCTLTSATFADSPPQTYACCGGCSQTAVSTKSFKAFQAWCKANPAPQCPPLGCAMPIMRAECEAGHCVAKDARAIAPPRP